MDIKQVQIQYTISVYRGTFSGNTTKVVSYQGHHEGIGLGAAVPLTSPTSKNGWAHKNINMSVTS